MPRVVLDRAAIDAALRYRVTPKLIDGRIAFFKVTQGEQVDHADWDLTFPVFHRVWRDALDRAQACACCGRLNASLGLPA